MIAAWLPAALFALVAWSVQRLLSKLALTTLGTRKFYLLSAVVSLVVYTPYLVWRPPAVEALLPAFGLACLMAVTFGITTEAIRRGPLGAVSPLTALSPAITAALALALLSERLTPLAYLGVAFAPIGVVLLSRGPTKGQGQRGWLPLAILSLILQGIGAFIAKLVRTASYGGGRTGSGRFVPGTTASLDGRRPPGPSCSSYRHRIRDCRNRDYRLFAGAGRRTGGGRRPVSSYEPSPCGPHGDRDPQGKVEPAPMDRHWARTGWGGPAITFWLAAHREPSEAGRTPRNRQKFHTESSSGMSHERLGHPERVGRGREDRCAKPGYDLRSGMSRQSSWA